MCAVIIILLGMYMAQLGLATGDNGVVYEFFNKERHVFGLLVTWNVSTQYRVENFTMTHQKRGSQATTHSGPLSPDLTEYYIEDLLPTTEYNVCLVSTLAEEDQAVCLMHTDTCKSCVLMSTIKRIRTDSLLAIVFSLSVFVVLPLIGYLCWLCARKQKERREKMARDEGKHPILRHKDKRDDGLRQSVDFEDLEIPYIDDFYRYPTITRI